MIIKIIFISFIIFLNLIQFTTASVRDPIIDSVEYKVGELELYFNGWNLELIQFNNTSLFQEPITFYNTTLDEYTGYYLLVKPLEAPYTITIYNTENGVATFNIFIHWCLNDCTFGVCNETSLECICSKGWGGTDCSIDQTFECKNNCSGNGVCNADMTCNCNKGYNGVACDQYIPDLGLSMKMNKSLTSPSIVIGSFDMNSSNKSLVMNKFTRASDYSIFISYIQEVNIYGEQIQLYNLTLSSWSLLESTDPKISIYETELSIGSKFVATIELISNETEREWAGQLIKIPSNSIKYSIRISNYTFTSNLNRLEMFYQATPNSALECSIKQQIAWGAKRSTDMHWVTLPNNQLQLYGRFSNYLIIDDRIVSNSNEGLEFGSTIQVKVNIPFFKDYAELDPDFSVLVDVNMDETVYDECGNIISTSNKKKWVIPVAVIVSVVGATIIFITVFSIYYKKNTTLRAKVLSFKSRFNGGNGGVSMK